MNDILDIFESLGDGLNSLAREQEVYKNPEKLRTEVAAWQSHLNVAVTGTVIMILLLMMFIAISCVFRINKRRKAILLQPDLTTDRKSSFSYIDFRKHANLV